MKYLIKKLTKKTYLPSGQTTYLANNLLRHLIRELRGHDPTEKYLPTYLNRYLREYIKS